MKHAEITDLTRVIESIVRASSLGDDVKQVEVEPEDAVEGGFLRVLLHVGHPERIEWAGVSAMVSEIESQVGEIDDRFPSIRYRKTA